MAKKEPISIVWQSVFMLFAPLALYAAYRVEKLRLFLVIIIVIVIVGMGLEFALFPDEFLEEESTDANYRFNIALWLVELGTTIILIRQWSREWNVKITATSDQDKD